MTAAVVIFQLSEISRGVEYWKILHNVKFIIFSQDETALAELCEQPPPMAPAVYPLTHISCAAEPVEIKSRPEAENPFLRSGERWRSEMWL